jgi:hypothetical protein
VQAVLGACGHKRASAEPAPNGFQVGGRSGGYRRIAGRRLTCRLQAAYASQTVDFLPTMKVAIAPIYLAAFVDKEKSK